MSHRSEVTRQDYETGIIIYLLNGERAAVKWRNLSTVPATRQRMLLKAKRLYPTALHVNFYHADRSFHYQFKFPVDG